MGAQFFITNALPCSHWQTDKPSIKLTMAILIWYDGVHGRPQLPGGDGLIYQFAQLFYGEHLA